MKRLLGIHHLILIVMMIVGLIFLISCKKEKEEILFTPAGTVTDIDGNTYNAIKIGTQIWMAENLKTTKYCNSDSLPNVTNDTSWSKLTSGAYCNYDNNNETAKTYGRLYNWYAVSDSRSIAPEGWHVPTITEWLTLNTYLGSLNIAGKLKEGGIAHWKSPNEKATNKSGFTALPGGYRTGFFNPGFAGIGESSAWWCPDEDLASPYLDDRGFGIATMYMSPVEGYSVRCIKD